MENILNKWLYFSSANLSLSVEFSDQAVAIRCWGKRPPPLHLKAMVETLQPSGLLTRPGSIWWEPISTETWPQWFPWERFWISVRGQLTRTSGSCLWPSCQNLRVASRVTIDEFSGWLLCKLLSEKYCSTNHTNHPSCSTTKCLLHGVLTSPPNSAYFSLFPPFFRWHQSKRDSSFLP